MGIEALEKKQAGGGQKLSKEKVAKMAAKKALEKERKELMAAGVDADPGVTPAPKKAKFTVPEDGLQKARLYLEMCHKYQMPIISTVLFHCRRMAKIELTKYQLLDDWKAQARRLEDAEKLLSEAEGYRDSPGSFVYDEEKARKLKELQAKQAYEADCRKKFEERMKRKADKTGVPLSKLLKATQVPGGKLMGVQQDPSWLQEAEGS